MTLVTDGIRGISRSCGSTRTVSVRGHGVNGLISSSSKKRFKKRKADDFGDDDKPERYEVISTEDVFEVYRLSLQHIDISRGFERGTNHWIGLSACDSRQEA